MASRRKKKKNSPSAVSSLLKQLAFVSDLTQDFDRRASDRLFASQEGGMVYYVFDSQIFHTYVEPYDEGHSLELFNGKPWLVESRETTRLSHERVASQITLLLTLFLFSGNLPGQRDNEFYISEWHLRELSDGWRQIQKSIAEKLRTGGIDIRRFLESNEVAIKNLEAGDTTTKPHYSTTVEQSWLSEDIERLRAEKIPESEINEYSLARHMGAYLIDDQLFETRNRLSHQFEICRSLRQLHDRFPISDKDDLKSLKDGLRSWTSRLRSENQNRESQLRGVKKNQPRGTRGLEKDAKTIAYVQWIAQNGLERNERIVLVLGNDHIAYNAYRRWHAIQPSGTPFVIRRIHQFIPPAIGIPGRRSISETSELFKKTQLALELGLVYFNLSTLSPEHLEALAEIDASSGTSELETREQIDTFLDSLHEVFDFPAVAASRSAVTSDDHKRILDDGRTYTSLLVAYARTPEKIPALRFFLNLTTPKAIRKQSKLMDLLGKEWAIAERDAIGANYLALKNEYDRSLSAIHDLKSQLADTVDQSALVEYILENLTTEAHANTEWIELMGAGSFVSQIRNRLKAVGHYSSRAPISLRIQIPVDDDSVAVLQSFDLMSLTERVWEGASDALEVLSIDKNPSLANRPDVVFAVASAFALSLNSWSDAKRFAGFAMDSCAIASKKDSAQNDDYLEYKYLYALTLRFQLANLNPRRHVGPDNPWRNYLDDIVTLLDECEEEHKVNGTDGPQTLRLSRVIGERAAARIMYANWALLSLLDCPQPEYELDFNDGLQEVNTALRELERVKSLEDVARERSNTGVNAPAPGSKAMFEKIRKQCYSNVAAAYVVRKLLVEQTSIEKPTGIEQKVDIEELASKLKELVREAGKNLPPIVVFDIDLFLHITNQEPINDIHESVKEIRNSPAAIDRAFCAYVRQHLLGAAN